jgi:HEAT repeat protein
LGEVLHSGTWWAPFRTAALRRGAAAALHRLGSPDAQDVLREAAERGSYGVRKAARQFAPSSKDPT